MYVCLHRIAYILQLIWVADDEKCEKYSKKEEALEKLRNGSKFDDVAREFSEDKARQGMYHPLFIYHFIHLVYPKREY